MVYDPFNILLNSLCRYFVEDFCIYVYVLCLVSQPCPTLCDPMHCSPPGSFVHGDSPGKNTGVGCHALLQGIFPTQGSNPGLLHCRRIFLHLSYQERHSNEYSGLISFRIDWFGLLTLQGTLKSLLQHHSLKASILQHPAFFLLLVVVVVVFFIQNLNTILMVN